MGLSFITHWLWFPLVVYVHCTDYTYQVKSQMRTSGIFIKLLITWQYIVQHEQDPELKTICFLDTFEIPEREIMVPVW